jgi:hypothetical protein
MSAFAASWAAAFYAAIEQDRSAADALRDASLRSDLATWTATLTGVVVSSFERLGWAAAGKGHRCSVLPVRRNEYLSLDVTAFPTASVGWQFPAAVCELENSADGDLVAYSLWKVLCVRCGLRVVFCYRPDASEGPGFVSSLAARVVEVMAIPDRVALGGETLVVVGSRSEASTFPYGFFQAWKLNSNTGRFERFARR